MTTTTIISSGYIAQDRDGYAIYGIGATEYAARTAALRECGPFEDRDGKTVGADDAQFGFDANFRILPATAALIAQVEAEGGAIAWDIIDGTACARGEFDGQQ